MQNPTLGRIVHLQDGGKLKAAMIVCILSPSPNMVNLCVYNFDGSTEGRTSVQMQDDGQPWQDGRWVWPQYTNELNKTVR